jgi:hypothetical protein
MLLKKNGVAFAQSIGSANRLYEDVESGKVSSREDWSYLTNSRQGLSTWQEQGRLYSTEEAVYAVRLDLPPLRAKVSKLGIRGRRRGQKVFHTKKQLEDVYNSVPCKRAKAVKRSATKQRAVAKQRKT